MKKIFKNPFIIFLLIFIIVFILIFVNKNSKTLNNYNIGEKLIVQFKWYTWSYILDLNTLKYSTFNSSFNNINVPSLKNIEKVYNYDKRYYYTENWIYDINNNNIYKFWTPSYSVKYWTKDWKYLINNDSQIVYLFNYFIPQRIWIFVPHIIEIWTWKSNQLLIYDENWKIMSIEKILWYILDN